MVRDLAGGPSGSVQTGEVAVAEVALEGDYLAAAGYEDPTQARIAAWNWRTGAGVASVALPRRANLPLPAIAADGSLAYGTRPNSCGGSLRLVRPGEPAPSELASDVCGNPEWAGEELVVQRGSRLVALTPGGAQRTLLNLGRVRLEGFAADAEDLAYILPTCAGRDAIHLVRTDAAAAGAGAPGCPLAVPRQTLMADEGRRVRVRVRCARGCFGVVQIRAGGSRVASAFYSRGGTAGPGQAAAVA